jgi:DNA invertase Pin-like site-specific DNA recombinase
MNADLLIPAAQYLRMSTEHQQYSLDNQQFAIEAYAVSNGFSIVRTYTDEARSGVVLKRRKALRQLLQDAISGNPGYQAILVYDISRWGRFQDADEAAHYEFLCKSAGIPVHYCAEMFINDGSMANILMKALKRTMAGEYSRELGAKVLAGLKRMARLGFKQGGFAGYGLRRMLISPSGEPKMQLASGEKKSIATDRVILVPGPIEEVECVREIYRMFLLEKRAVHAIAVELNRRKIKFVGEAPWTSAAVYNILSHAKYMGSVVYGRTTQRLGTPPTRTPDSEWIVTPGAFTPLVDETTFRAAQSRLLARTTNRSNEDILTALRSLLARKGRLSMPIIEADPETPSCSTYRYRFGSMGRAYELVGYGKPGDFGSMEVRRRTQALREQLVLAIQTLFPSELSLLRQNRKWRSVLRLEAA